MANGWEKHGPRIMINDQQSPGSKPEAAGYRPQARKQQAASVINWPCSYDIKNYVKERSKTNYRWFDRAPGKMPEGSYNIPASSLPDWRRSCAKVEGTPCSGCYAFKGNYGRYPDLKRLRMLYGPSSGEPGLIRNGWRL